MLVERRQPQARQGRPPHAPVPEAIAGTPQGFGAKIVSAAGASQLLLTACPGVRHVRLVVTPGRGRHDNC